MKNMKEQYLVTFQHRNDEEGVWWNAMMFVPWAKKGQRFATSLEEAKRALADNIERDNGKGARVEFEKCGYVGVELVIDEETAKEFEIVRYKIQKRMVTPWEDVESSEL